MQPTERSTSVCSAGVVDMDVLRVTVVINGLNLTGWQIAAMLREDHEVIPELASLKVPYPSHI